MVPDDLAVTRSAAVVLDTSVLMAALEAHIATLKTELAGEKERADRAIAEFAGERAVHRDELAAARAAADRSTAELVELARWVATPEPEPQRSRFGQAWRWFLSN
jgi:hypothetical protein